MARKKKDGAEPVALPQEQTSRALAIPEGEKLRNWANEPESQAFKDAAKLYEKIQKCFDNKQEQGDRCEEYWHIFNAELDENQQYMGNSQTYVPAVRDAIKKKIKRTLRQLFPVGHTHVTAVDPLGEEPFANLALAEHYIRNVHLKSIVRSDLIAGAVTGQWALYVDWTKAYRDVRTLIRTPRIVNKIAGEELNGVDLDDMDDEAFDETLEDEEVVTEGPEIVNAAVEDIVIYPPTCTDPKKAKASGIKLRMSVDEVQRMIDEGVFVGDQKAQEFVDKMGQPDGGREKKTPPKQRTNEAGVKTEGTYKYALIYEIETKLKLDKDYAESCLVYYAGKDWPIGIIRNPQWSGLPPLITSQVERIAGTAYGKSEVEPVKWLQWCLNDFHAMGMDSAQYSMLPIVMTDPLKNPNYQSMVIGLAAVWLTDPKTTEFASFPAIWKDSAAITEFLKKQIQESLDVNDAVMGKMPQGRKNNAMIGAAQQEQQSEITDLAERYEEEILNPLIDRIMMLDAQFRTEDLLVETMGEIGYRAKMAAIGPQDFGYKVSYRWAGTAYQMNLQRMQQMIAWVNVLRGIPPQQLNGRKLDVTPVLEFGTQHMCGPEMARRILIDERNMFTIPAEEENIMLFNGLPTMVHEADNHQEHLKIHQQVAVQTGDPAGHFRTHIMEHMKAMQLAMQKQMGMQQPNQGAAGQGMPGGAAPGVPGSPKPGGGGGGGGPQPPRIGAQPGAPRLQGPPGTIHADQMPGPGRG